MSRSSENAAIIEQCGNAVSDCEKYTGVVTHGVHEAILRVLLTDISASLAAIADALQSNVATDEIK